MCFTCLNEGVIQTKPAITAPIHNRRGIAYRSISLYNLLTFQILSTFCNLLASSDPKPSLTSLIHFTD